MELQQTIFDGVEVCQQKVVGLLVSSGPSLHGGPCCWLPSRPLVAAAGLHIFQHSLLLWCAYGLNKCRKVADGAFGGEFWLGSGVGRWCGSCGSGFVAERNRISDDVVSQHTVESKFVFACWKCQQRQNSPLRLQIHNHFTNQCRCSKPWGVRIIF